MSHITETVIEKYFQDTVVDWDNRYDITVPSDVRTVVIDFFPRGTAQSGATNALLMRVNAATGASYCNGRKYHNGTSFTSSFTSNDTSLEVYDCISSGNQGSNSQVTLHTRNSSKGADAMHYGQVVRHCNDGTVFNLETRLIRVLDSVNPVGSINIFTSASTAVSFGMKVRFCR